MKKIHAARPTGLWTLAVLSSFLVACGGGGGAGEPGLSSQADLHLDIAEASLPSGSRQVQLIELRNAGTVSALQVQIRVAPDAKLAQLALLCPSALANRCQQRTDGGLDISELRAAEAMVLEQVLMLAPGYSGKTSAQWTLSHAAAPAPLQRTQQLQALSHDVAVSVAEAQRSNRDGKALISYELTLSNAGPDEARDVDWRLMAAPGMRWLSASCTAAGAVQCPTTLAETMHVPRLAMGASLRLRVDYQARDGGGLPDTDFVSTTAAAAGDAQGNNNAALAQTSNALGSSLHATDLHGRRYEMSSAVTGSPGWRARHESTLFEDPAMVDVTGFVRLGDAKWPESGAFNGRGDVKLGAYDFGSGRVPFWAGKSVVQDLRELQGLDFNVLASRADASGQARSGAAWSGQFKGTEFLLCQSPQPTPLTECPREALKHYVVHLVGSELELLAGAEVRRLRAFSTSAGPMLFMADASAAGAASAEVWVGLPARAMDPRFSVEVPASESNFMQDGRSFQALFIQASGAQEGQLRLRDYYEALSSYWEFYLQNHACDVPYGASGLMSPGKLPGLLSGTLTLERCGKPLEQGAVFSVQGPGLYVVLGASGGPFAGRWLYGVSLR